MAGDTQLSDAAVRKATGHGWAYWMKVLDGFDRDLNHTERANALRATGEIDAWWWCQMVTVEYERRRGLREVGQSHRGDYQVSATKTVDRDADECFERVVRANFLPNAEWTVGAAWETDGGSAEVRIVEPGKQLRWFWYDKDGKSTVTVGFWPTKSGKMQITFSHSGLASAEAREHYRAKWKAALAIIVR